MAGCRSCMKAKMSRVGDNVSTALVIGEQSHEILRVKVKKPVAGLLPGAVKYVRGDGTQALIDDGSFEVINRVNNARHNRVRKGQKLYYVGDLGYTSLDTARVRSEESGLPIQERTIG